MAPRTPGRPMTNERGRVLQYIPVRPCEAKCVSEMKSQTRNERNITYPSVNETKVSMQYSKVQYRIVRYVGAVYDPMFRSRPIDNTTASIVYVARTREGSRPSCAEYRPVYRESRCFPVA